jgi:preprotein translocase subunit SecF
MTVTMTNASTGKTQSSQSEVGKGTKAGDETFYRIDVYRHRWLFLLVSIVFLIPGIYFMVINTLDPAIGSPIRLGIDFKGGTLLEYGFSKTVRQPDINTIRLPFDEKGYTGSIIQIESPRLGINKKPVEIGQVENKAQNNTAEVVSEMNAAGIKNAEVKSIVSIRTKQLKGDDEKNIRVLLEKNFGAITVLQRNTMGPSLARELMTNGILALVMAYALIMAYLTIRFQFDFAVCAMIALIHDTLFLFGAFALLGNLFGTEVDSLFVTAVLTVVGFSVHDTIVVFDRIRENARRYFTKKTGFREVVNISIHQTLARSINTSLTALLTMLALFFLGGETTRDFVLAIIIGIAAGTYSSIFNASVLLTMWRYRQERKHA